MVSVKRCRGKVSHKKNFVAEFIRFKLIFILKNETFAFRATLWGS